ESAWVATDRAATWKTQAVSSPAILYMLGSISRKPCEAVNVVVSAPLCREPWTAPAAPPSACISCTTGTAPQIFLMPSAAQASASSAIVEDGVIGKIAHTSLTRYAIWAAAVLPSMTAVCGVMCCVSFYDRCLSGADLEFRRYCRLANQ